MNPVEFVATCKLGGYCDRRTAEQYINDHPKPDYDTDDIIAVYHITDKPCAVCHGKSIGNGYYADGERSRGFTTKRYWREGE